MVVSKYSENQNNILFTGDREAVTAYCNGEAVNNISAYIETANTGPYSFKSEYNKGLYSIDIQGNTELSTNMLPAPYINNISGGGLTVAVGDASNNYSIHITGTTNGQFGGVQTLQQNILLQQGTYAFALFPQGLSHPFYEIVLYGQDGSPIQSTDGETFTVDEGYFNVKIILNPNSNTGSIVDDTIYLQINQGTSAEPYVPYGIFNMGDNGTKITLKSNKNLCNVSPSNQTNISGQYQLTYPSTQEFKMKWLGATAMVGYRVELEPNTTYVFSFNINVTENSGASYIRLSWEASTQSSYEFKRFTYNTNGSYSDSFVFNSGTHTYMYVIPWVFQSTIQGTLQVEKGSSQTVYEPYFNQSITIPSTYQMAKIGDTADEIIISKGKIKYIQRIYRKVFNGNETFTVANGYPSRFNINIITQNTSVSPICTHYVGSKIWWAQMANNRITTYTGATLCIRDDRFTTVTEFKNYLQEQYEAGIPVIAEFVLDTPIETDITSQIDNYEDFISTPYNTNLSIDIESLLPPSAETLKYLKWGGKT